VSSGRDGKPEAVRYQLLDPLLLSELQKQHRTIDEQRRRIETLEARLAKVEAAQSATDTRR